MKSVSLAVLSVIFSLFTFAASAQQTLVHCTKTSGSSGWVPDAFTYSRAGKSKAITVSDPLILAFVKAPIAGRVNRENGQKLVLTWKVRGVQDSRGTKTPALTFKATINKANLSYNVVATPLGFSETFTGRGTCSVVPAAQVNELTSRIRSAGERAQKNDGILHSLWAKDGDRKFSCELAPPRKTYDWSLRTVSVTQITNAQTASVQFTTLGGRERRQANAQVAQNEEVVIYSWDDSVDDPRGRGFTEPAQADVTYRLFVELKSGQASLHTSARPSRRKSVSRVPAGCT